MKKQSETKLNQTNPHSIKEGIVKGKIQGEDKALKLSEFLLAAGRVADLKKAANDKAFCRKLYKEFNIF